MLFSLLTLAVSAPVFYLLIKDMYLREADETLVLHKKEFVLYAAPVMKVTDIGMWNQINRNLKLERPSFELERDSLFDQVYYDTLDAEYEPYRVLLTTVSIEGHPYHLRAKLNMVEAEDLVENIALVFLLIVFLLLTGLYIITRRLSKKLWQPFYHTLEQIQRFEIDKSTPFRLPDTQIEEFSRLNASLTNLVERNRVIYKSQQEFIENAAHELQTPLAVFQAKLETFIQNPALTAEQADVVLELSRSASRLNRLNKNLLLLSKIDNHNYTGKESIRLKDILEKLIGFFEEQAREKNISVILQTEAPGETSSNPVLAEIVISNLLFNAIRHNVQDGRIIIALNRNTLTISNSGHPAALASDRLFMRFSRPGAVSHGSGLGLAIIKKIADLNGWQVAYHYKEHLHVFNLHF